MTQAGPIPQAGPFRPGTGYRDGKLYIFERYALTVMKPWPEPLAFRRTTRTPFRPVRPAVTLVRGPLTHAERCSPWQVRRYEATEAFMAGVPQDMRRRIGQFETRQWHMMALVARCPGAGQLVDSTPALAFALASNWVFAKRPVRQPMRAVRSLLRKKQTEICGWLGFPPRVSTVKMLRKLRTCDVSIRALLMLREVLWDEQRSKLLRHAPSITDCSLRIVSSRARQPHFSAKFLAEIGAIAYDEAGLEKFSTLQFAAQPWLLQHAKDRVFDTVAQLVNFANRVAPIPEQRTCPADSVFPAPPFAGTECIVPIRTGQQLMDEAAALQHCGVIYHDRIVAGVNAFYSLLAPERATIVLERKDGIWRLNQITGFRNATLSHDAYSAVDKWLSEL